MDADLVLWILQVALAIAFVASGLAHLLGYDRMASHPRMGWMAVVGKDRVRLVGALDILGGIGVVLPATTGILPWLVPVAAAGLALIMVAALAFHLRRPGEGASAAFNAVLGALALTVAIGRTFIAPL